MSSITTKQRIIILTTNEYGALRVDLQNAKDVKRFLTKKWRRLSINEPGPSTITQTKDLKKEFIRNFNIYYYTRVGTLPIVGKGNTILHPLLPNEGLSQGPKANINSLFTPQRINFMLNYVVNELRQIWLEMMMKIEGISFIEGIKNVSVTFDLAGLITDNLKLQGALGQYNKQEALLLFIQSLREFYHSTNPGPNLGQKVKQTMIDLCYAFMINGYNRSVSNSILINDRYYDLNAIFPQGFNYATLMSTVGRFVFHSLYTKQRPWMSKYNQEGIPVAPGMEYFEWNPKIMALYLQASVSHRMSKRNTNGSLNDQQIRAELRRKLTIIYGRCPPLQELSLELYSTLIPFTELNVNGTQQRENAINRLLNPLDVRESIRKGVISTSSIEKIIDEIYKTESRGLDDEQKENIKAAIKKEAENKLNVEMITLRHLDFLADLHRSGLCPAEDYGTSVDLIKLRATERSTLPNKYADPPIIKIVLDKMETVSFVLPSELQSNLQRGEQMKTKLQGYFDPSSKVMNPDIFKNATKFLSTMTDKETIFKSQYPTFKKELLANNIKVTDLDTRIGELLDKERDGTLTDKEAIELYTILGNLSEAAAEGLDIYPEEDKFIFIDLFDE